MAEKTYYLANITYFTSGGIVFQWGSLSVYAERLQMGDVALLNYKDSDEGTNEYHVFADESTSEPSFSEYSESDYANYNYVSYDSTEEQNLIDRFGDLDLVDLSSAQAYVDSYMDGIVEQALANTTQTQFTNKRIRYIPTNGELSSIEGSEVGGTTLSDTLTRMGEYS